MISAKSGETSDKKPRTRSKEERKQQLIEATIKSIAKYGITGTTMTTVTGIAGLSMGLVNFHFESKQKLFEETLLFLALEHQEMWKAAIARKGMTAEERILALVDAQFHAKISSRDREAAWISFYGDRSSREAYRRIAEQIDDARCDRLAEMFAELKTTGDFDHIVPEDVALVLEALFDGLSLTRLIYPTDATRADAKRHVHTYLRAMFPGRFGGQSASPSQGQT